jgi:hypothetical protein
MRTGQTILTRPTSVQKNGCDDRHCRRCSEAVFRPHSLL